MIAEIEELILSALKEHYTSTGVDVEEFAGDIEDYTLRASQAAILVMYPGGDAGMQDSQEVVRQMFTPQFTVFIVARNKRTHTGCYGIMDEVRAELIGIEYRETRLAFVKEEFVGKKNGVWYYAQVFAIRQRVRQV